MSSVGKPILKRHRIFIPRRTVGTDKSVYRALRTYGASDCAIRNMDNHELSRDICIWVTADWKPRGSWREVGSIIGGGDSLLIIGEKENRIFSLFFISLFSSTSTNVYKLKRR